MTGCAAGTSGVTDLGIVPPSSSVIGGSDCHLVFGSSNDTASLRIEQTDGYGEAMYRPTSGALDTGYAGGAGFLVAAIAGTEVPLDADVAPDGSVYVLYDSSSSGNVRIARFTPAGTLDVGWGTSGYVTTQLSDPPVDEIGGIDVMDDGRILIAGSSGGRGAVERRTSAGGVDGSFGTGGVTLSPNLAGTEQFHSVFEDPQGRVVASGEFNTGNGTVVTRLMADGTLDSTFGTSGSFSTNLPTHSGEGLLTLSATADGGYVAGGFVDGTNNPYVIRLTETGTLLNSFSGDGVLDGIGAAGDDWTLGVWQEPNGTYLLGLGGASVSRIGRVLADGSWDPSFPGGGVFTTSTTFWAVDRAESGDVLTIGEATSGDTDIAMQRYSSAGVIDATFGTSGTQIIDAQPAAHDSGEEIVPGVDGDVMFVGSTNSNGNLIVGSLAGTPVAGYDDAGNDDWSTPSAGFFGACLRDAGAGAVGTWTEAASCTGVDGTTWNEVPAAATTIASTAAPTMTATADLRFALRATPLQGQGAYVAPITFSVVAPAA
ncbi:MAG: hypothetical protein KDC46_03870 [Thermoleophilia bacterium]|nr:hypothetical protein [Thermoleophilia bacterium]